jgi:predicted O-methyltransferase YrrM
MSAPQRDADPVSTIPQSMLERLIRGSSHRRTRFHDEKGNRVDLVGALYAPAAFATALARTVFGLRLERPMISYRAARYLNALIQPSWQIVEFGSGWSTPWLARRCVFLLSIEDNPAWHARIGARLRRYGFRHVRHELRSGPTYCDLAEFPDGSFDFALIDGSARAGCVANTVAKIKSGGWLYLDNTDKDVGCPDGDMRRAEAALLEAVRQRGGTARYFTDFAPGNFFVEQGLLVRL